MGLTFKTLLASCILLSGSGEAWAACWKLKDGSIIESNSGSTPPVAGANKVSCPAPAPPPRASAPRGPYPIDGSVTQRYGDVWSEKSSKTHTGVDIAASKGTAVPSMSNGRVAAIVDLGGRWGKAVVIEEPSGKARGYLHIDPTVRRGDTVVAGDKLGTVTRDHLHYNVCREVALCHRGALPTSKPDPEYPGDPLFPGPFLKP